MSVIFLPEVRKYFNNLIPVLYEKEYFGFKETAKKYVDDLLVEIVTNLPICLHKPASNYFDKYGKNMEYAVFKKSKHTQWYVFFRAYKENDEEIYQVRYIGNNHTVAQYL